MHECTLLPSPPPPRIKDQTAPTGTVRNTQRSEGAAFRRDEESITSSSSSTLPLCVHTHKHTAAPLPPLKPRTHLSPIYVTVYALCVKLWLILLNFVRRSCEKKRDSSSSSCARALDTAAVLAAEYAYWGKRI
eukprot:1336-Heterococcus_DN1.PRE.2